MVQNHLLQLLSLVAMEPPTDLTADGVRDEKVKVIRSLRQWDTPEKVAANVVRAQYTAGHVDGNPVPGYREEDRVNPQSDTEAYVAVRLLIDTWRWSGVPFYIRMGKRLPKKSTEISIHFKDAPCVLFNTPAAASRRQRAGHPHPARRRHLAAHGFQNPRQQPAPRTGQNGFPLRHQLRQNQPRSL
jgi:glucose-6-phosphate 1-dehydrogenase